MTAIPTNIGSFQQLDSKVVKVRFKTVLRRIDRGRAIRPTRVSIKEMVLAYWRAEGCCSAIAVFGSRTRNITLILTATVRRASVSKVEA